MSKLEFEVFCCFILKIIIQIQNFALYPNTLMLPSMITVKVMALSLIILFCTYMNMNKHIILNITNSYHTKLIVYMFLGMINCYWTTNWYILPWSRPLFPFQLSSVVYSSLRYLRPYGLCHVILSLS